MAAVKETRRVYFALSYDQLLQRLLQSPVMRSQGTELQLCQFSV
jgi:hypothetical protein